MGRPSRRSRGTITIEDVAAAAGVSAMTVSRVINGEKNVRDTTRAAVQEAIAKLNYWPNSAARSLAAGEATHIGMLYANPSAAYLSQFLVGALEGARRRELGHPLAQQSFGDPLARHRDAAHQQRRQLVEANIRRPRSRRDVRRGACL